MATYKQIEEIRQAGKKYVEYEYSKIDPKFPDAFDIENLHCYAILVGPQGEIRKQIIDDNLIQHDIFKADPTKPNFSMIEKALREKGFESNIEYFKRLTTLNVKGDYTCKLVLIAGAHINYEKITKDILNCDSKYEVSEVLKTLTEQVNCAAINGAWFKFVAAAGILNPAKDLTPEDEKRIKNTYKKIILGEKERPVQIPHNPSLKFSIPNSIYIASHSLDDFRKDPEPNTYFVANVMKYLYQERDYINSHFKEINK